MKRKTNFSKEWHIMSNYNNETLIELENKITELKYHLSVINKLSLAGADVDSYLDGIDIDSLLDGFDADKVELP